MGATGQRCTATSRVYVEAPAYEGFLERLIERVTDLRVGDPYDEATDVGPLAFAEQQRTVARYLDLARAGEATIAAGGEVADPARGYYVDPTVLTEVDPESALMREEIFGPVVAVTPVPDLEAALEAANDTPFGLSASLFSSDLESALTFARRIASGQVHVNRETAGAEPHVPFGGLKGSSNLQREQGKAARRFFTNSKTVYVRPR
jgi:aldehyde dehydrogenase (NAD+)